tara:strand:+ start:398 stop:1459 length:1062 start_codon:yes stop_codon:yes gene_type:complete
MAFISFNPTDHFSPKTYSGTGSTQTISGFGFQPDMTWIKDRGTGNSHDIYDSVRGAGKRIRPSSVVVENDRSGTDSVSAWTSDGFTLIGANGANNESGLSYATWNWKAGTTSGIATNGSTTITPSAYSFNQTAGFSIVTYTGNDTAGAKVAHGLGATPALIIIKSRTSENSWNVYHQSNGATKYMLLDSNESVNTNTNRWNDTAPDSVNFTLGSTGATNGSGSDSPFIAYCFAEKKGYSRFGTFTGTGQVDGPFIPLGFRAAFFMYKRVDAAAHWTFHTNKIDGYNEVTKSINANEDNAESTSTGDNDIDICANGVKIREDNTHINYSGGSLIYIAFAEFPFVSSNGKAGVAR